VARYTDPLCRVCRAQGKKLFLKGEKCYTKKCPLERGKGLPGQKQVTLHFSKPSDYKIHLQEKQRVRRMYGILEKQFRKNFKEAAGQKKIPTGDKLLELLERRIDNVVFRMGFAPNRRTARQLVLHGHFSVNGHKVTIPSYIVKEGDVIEIREGSRQITIIKEMIDSTPSVPSWLEVNAQSFKGVVKQIPNISELSLGINSTLIVELYSK